MNKNCIKQRLTAILSKVDRHFFKLRAANLSLTHFVT